MACCFTVFGLVACGKTEAAEIDVYAPDGAPALALAYAMHSDGERDGVSYHVVEASTIAAYVSNKDREKNADVCLLPVNLAAKLLGGGEEYQLLGVATHGNLYLLGEKPIGKNNAEELKGKTVGVVQLANVPGLVTKAVLSDLGLSYALLSDGGPMDGTKVNLKGVVPSRDLAALGIDYLVAPSPAAERLGLPFAASLQELYGDGNGYPQAVIVAKRTLIESDTAWVRAFLAQVESGAAWLKTAEIESICGAVEGKLHGGIAPTFTPKTLSREAIENASVYFSSAMESKTEIKEFLRDLSSVATENFEVSDGFFYGGVI